MLRAKLNASPASDVEGLVRELALKGERSGLSPASLQSLTTTTESVLQSLVTQGRQLAAQGSQLNVTRSVDGPGFSVELRFRARPTTSWLSHFFRR
jgi:hypothetical protein